MLSSLLTAFRQRYPNASMVSELLNIHDGLYIVRVTLNADGMALVTALAAQSVVEAAEDLALNRALERLGLPLSPHPTLADQPPSAVITTTGPALVGPSKLVDSTRDQPTSEKPMVLPPPAPIATTTPTQSQGSSGVDLAMVGKLPPAEEINLSPIDLSDIIAQTDVELQRLGWGTSQGREFLERTYGKRSRHDLSDEELLEFLLYLETQPPSPGSAG
ncbi:MAG: hypothetical protein ACOYMP_02735 [Nodosilinea sp.]